MNNPAESMIFTPVDILLPHKSCDLSRWAVLACDQFTSQPEYWREADAAVGNAPSTLRMVIPEVYLEEEGLEQRIASTHQAMREYAADVLTQTVQGYIYVERILDDGTTRHGLVGAVDLEAYSYEKGAQTQIRPSENTVVERIPPRLAVRRGAILESPHIIMLADDTEETLIEPFADKTHTLPLVYDTPLMLGGGRVRGWAVTSPENVRQINVALAKLGDNERFCKRYSTKEDISKPFTLVVGDGNHSLATAKAYWEEIKPTLSAQAKQTHPARFCLAELENIQSPAIKIEPIHRAVFHIDPDDFLWAASVFAAESGAKFVPAGEGNQEFTVLYNNKQNGFSLAHSPWPLAVASLEAFLHHYAKDHPEMKIDYIHGEDAVQTLVSQGAIGILLPPFAKSDLFRGVALGGVLPKKTFSMGHATQKRYYLECRKIIL